MKTKRGSSQFACVQRHTSVETQLHTDELYQHLGMPLLPYYLGGYR